MESDFYYILDSTEDVSGATYFDGVSGKRYATLGWHESDYIFGECPGDHRERIVDWPPIIEARFSKGTIGDAAVFLTDFAIATDVIPIGDYEEFKGAVVRPLQLKGRSAERDYAVVGTCTYVPLEPKRSRSKLKYHCPICGFASYEHPDNTVLFPKLDAGFEVPDIFFLDGGWAFPIVSQRFADFLKAKKLTGLVMAHISSVRL